MTQFNGFRLMTAVLVAALTPVAGNATQQSPVALGSNTTFAVLAGTTVTVTGGGTITGNIGISPGTAYVAGNPPVTVSGVIYAGGPVAAQAQADLTTAFNDAAGRQTPVIVAGNIGGQTLTPGLYKSTSSLAVSSGDLTLDAQGNANAVFLFQIASTLTLTSGRQVILAGGANAANIFWQVGSSATLGTTSVLHGNILAAVSISMLTGATLDGRALAQGGAVSIDTGGGSSVTRPASSAPAAPTVTSTVPANALTGVPLGSQPTATFSTSMDPSTITASTYTLMQGTTPIAGAVTYTGLTATFSPVSALAPLSTFTATLTTGVRDTAGTALAGNYVWSFTTGSAQDTTPPTVTSTVPAAGALSVGVNSKIAVTFSKAMDPSTLTPSTFIVMQGMTAITGSMTYAGNTVTLTPSSNLAPLATFTATLTRGVKDLARNALAQDYVWSFTTGPAADTTRPMVVATVPANATVGIPSSTNIRATFSKPMDPATVTTATFLLLLGTTPVAGSVTYQGLSASFTPTAVLAPNTTYTGTVLMGAADLAGNALASTYTWTFSTEGVLARPPVIFPAGTVNNANGTLNDASYVSPVAAGSIAAIFGSDLSVGQSNSQVPSPLPTLLDASSFTVGGLPAPIYFASPNQVNVQIPWEVAGRTEAQLIATVNGVASNTQLVSLAPFAPGIFSMDSTGSGQGAVLIAPTAQLAASGTPVPRGAYISIFCTGLGPVTNQPPTGVAAQAAPLSFSIVLPTVTIGGVDAAVSYSGLAPGLVGLYQVNAHVPPGVDPGNAVPVLIRIGGATSNTVTIAVQ